MTRRHFAAVAMALVCVIATATTSHAKHRHYHYRLHADANGNDARPRAWCGWQMRQWLNVADRSGNLARWWAGYGTRASGPAVGTIIVWRHHVGLITARTDSGWVVKSGNDGHAVRERERPIRGAIAFRWPNRLAMQ